MTKKVQEKATQRNVSVVGWIAIAAAVIVATELTSWAALSLLQNKWATYRMIIDQMQLVAAGEKETPSKEQGLFTWEEYFHPYFGVSYTQYQKKNVRGQGQEQLTDYGFKEDAGPLMKERDPKTVIINITGGSVARGFLDYGGREVLSQELKQYPAFSDKNIIFSSTAFYGHKGPQQLLAINYLLTLGAKFDYIIALDGFNEITMGKVYNENAGASSFYPWGWYGRVWKFDQLPGNNGIKTTIDDLRHKRVVVARGFSFVNWSMAGNFLWSASDRLIASRMSKIEAEASVQSAPKWNTLVDSGPLTHYANNEEYLADQASIWREATRQLARLSRANGIRFFSILQPNQYAGNHVMSDAEKSRAWNPQSPFRPLVEQGYPILRQEGLRLQNEEGMVFADFSDLFDNVNEDIYTDDCCHFNAPMGNLLLARRLAALIAESVSTASQ